tara:strand:- start:446 stop:724 length:279 start_codon:yes stop_codon:yes gene_type:complete
MKGVTRLNDADVPHCSLPKRAEASLDVFVEGFGISRQGDENTLHDNCNSSTHSTKITTGSLTVFVNGKGCGRIGDLTGCTSVAEGSLTVFAG